jgi:D-alanyl-D-alanine dipeptidase
VRNSYKHYFFLPMIINYYLLIFTLILGSFTSARAQKSDTTKKSDFVKLNDLASEFAFDMRYATTNNFLKEKVYPCETCLVRTDVSKALLKANNIFKEKGFKIKFFDCYRPVDVQKKMWAIMPDSRYVANPNKSGSIHNRGAAVDITLVDNSGKELDMGTAFDHFGVEAHHSYQNLPAQVLENRKYLKKIMEQCGFVAQSTEWWHYNYGDRSKYSISNEELCK